MAVADTAAGSLVSAGPAPRCGSYADGKGRYMAAYRALTAGSRDPKYAALVRRYAKVIRDIYAMQRVAFAFDDNGFDAAGIDRIRSVALDNRWEPHRDKASGLEHVLDSASNESPRDAVPEVEQYLRLYGYANCYIDIACDAFRNRLQALKRAERERRAATAIQRHYRHARYHPNYALFKKWARGRAAASGMQP